MQMMPVPGGQALPIVSSRPLPIPWGAIKSYADHYQIAGDEFELFARYLRAMDTEYLTIFAEQRAGKEQDDNG